MKKAYCYWPVKLRGYVGEAHITCNWFGDAEFELEQVAIALEGMDRVFSVDPRKLKLVPEKFNEKTHVLVIENPDQEAIQIQAALDYIRPHDYPTWRPHITIDPTFWRELVATGIPKNLIESIGPLTMKRDGEIFEL